MASFPGPYRGTHYVTPYSHDNVRPAHPAPAAAQASSRAMPPQTMQPAMPGAQYGQGATRQRLMQEIPRQPGNETLLERLDDFFGYQEPELTAFVEWANSRSIDLMHHLQAGTMILRRWGLEPRQDLQALENFYDWRGYLRGLTEHNRANYGHLTRDIVLPFPQPQQVPDRRSPVTHLSYYEKSGISLSRDIFADLERFIDTQAWRYPHAPASDTASFVSDTDSAESVAQLDLSTAAPRHAGEIMSTKSVRNQHRNRENKAITNGRAATDNRGLLNAYAKYFGPTDGAYRMQVEHLGNWLAGQHRDLVVPIEERAMEEDDEHFKAAIIARNDAIDAYYDTLDSEDWEAKSFVEDLVGFLEEVSRTKPSIAIDTHAFESLRNLRTLEGIEDPQVLPSGYSVGKTELARLLNRNGLVACPFTRDVYAPFACVPNLAVDDLTHNYRHYQFILRNGEIPAVLRVFGTEELNLAPVILLLDQRDADGDLLEAGTTISAAQAREWNIRVDKVDAVENRALKAYLEKALELHKIPVTAPDQDSDHDSDDDSNIGLNLLQFPPVAQVSARR